MAGGTDLQEFETMTRKRKTKRNRKNKTIEKSNGSTWNRRGWIIAVALGLVVAVLDEVLKQTHERI